VDVTIGGDPWVVCVRLQSGLLQLRLSSQCRRTLPQILPVCVLRRQPGGRAPTVQRARHMRNARHSRLQRRVTKQMQLAHLCESYLGSTLLSLAKLDANRGQPPDPYPPLSRFRIAHRVCRRSKRDATAYMPTPIAAITRSAAKTSGTRNVELAEIMR